MQGAGYSIESLTPSLNLPLKHPYIREGIWGSIMFHISMIIKKVATMYKIYITVGPQLSEHCVPLQLILIKVFREVNKS